VTPGGTIAAVPALPLHTAGKYVAGAYIVLFLVVLIYVAIMAIRLSRIEDQLGELLGSGEGSAGGSESDTTGTRYPDERLADGEGTDVQDLADKRPESTPA
jgi:hypothetical protein